MGCRFRILRVVCLFVLFAKPVKAVTEVTAGAEIRFRVKQQHNYKFKEGHSGNYIEQRSKLNMLYKGGEKLEGFIGLLHSGNWGPASGQRQSYEKAGLSVHQAYVNWMLSDDLKLKAGRQSIQFGDGSLFSENDYEAHPQTFDGLEFRYEAEFAGVSVWGVKSRDYGYDGVEGTDHDPEDNLYILSVDFKQIPGFIKMLNVHLVKNAAQASDGNGDDIAASEKRDETRIGMSVSGSVPAGVDYSLSYLSSTGKASANQLDIEQSMLGVEMGVSFWKQRLFLGYHTDSGQKDDPAEVEQTYKPLAYNKYENAGALNLLGWGNLTYLYGGVDLKASENLKGGVSYYVFSRTEEADNTYDPYGSIITGASGERAIGNEVDIWAKHVYDSGTENKITLSFFTPGDVLKDQGEFGSAVRATLALEAVFKF